MSATSPPNILLIIPHDTGRHLGCYGRGVATPRLDALAAAGVRLDQAYCPVPLCMPSRAGLMTGRSPHAVGVHGLPPQGWGLDETHRTLPRCLSELGYHTVQCGTQHDSINSHQPESKWARLLGYDDVLNVSKSCDDATDAALAWLRGWAKVDRPFFMSLGFKEAHRVFPTQVDPHLLESAQLPPYLPDDDLTRRDVAGLNTLVMQLDVQVGRLLDELDALALRENTLVIFTTDHGVALPRAKGTCYDAGLEVAMLAHLPGRIEGGRVLNELTSHLDILPTLVELAGGAAPTDVEGRSLLPLLEGRSWKPHDFVTGGCDYHGIDNPMRTIRTRRYRYIRNYTPQPAVNLPTDILNVYEDHPLALRCLDAQRPAEELYDREAEAFEQTNLADDADHADLLTLMREQMDAWMAATDDPLTHGALPETSAQHERALRTRQRQRAIIESRRNEVDHADGQ